MTQPTPPFTRFLLVCRPTIQHSGLYAYAEGLRGALRAAYVDCRIRAQHDLDPLPDEAVVWVGFDRDEALARTAVERMAHLNPRVRQLVLPEWEQHAPKDLVDLLKPLRDRRLLFILPNNVAAGVEVVAGSAVWTGGYVPTPLDQRSFRRRPIKRAAPSALYLGRDAPIKKLAELARAWCDLTIDELAPLTLYVPEPISEELADVVRQGENLSLHRLSGLLTPARFDFYAHHQIFISASQYEYGPIAAVEAMAAGCVPVLSAAPGHLDLAARSDSVVIYDDFNDLRDRIKQLVADPRCLDSQRRASVRYARSAHAPVSVTTRIIELAREW